MSHVDLDELIARVARLPDRDVIKALASAADYTPEALVVYEAEAKRRGIPPAAVRPVALRVAQENKDRVALARSFKGIGEKLYGRRSFRADGSYQTTKWFVFFYLPIYPLCSLRLRPGAHGGISVVEVLPIDRRQVVDTYCFVVVAWAAVAMGIRYLEEQAVPYSELLSVALLVLPFVFLYMARHRAQRSVQRTGKR